MILNWSVYLTAITVAIIAYGAHSLDVNRLHNEWADAQSEALDKQALECELSKQPKEEADNVSETNLAHSLDVCLSQLRQPSKCIPVSRPASGATTANRQTPSGINSAAIEVNNIECQKDRDSLNTAKLWAIGYQKFKDQQ